MSKRPRTTQFDLHPDEVIPPYFRTERTLQWCAALVFAGLHPEFQVGVTDPRFRAADLYGVRRERDACVRDTRSALAKIAGQPEMLELGSLPCEGREVWPLHLILHAGNSWSDAQTPRRTPEELHELETVSAHALSTSIFSTDPSHVASFSGGRGDIRTQLLFEASGEARSAHHYLKQLTIDRRPTHRQGWIDDLRIAAYGTSAQLRLQLLLCMDGKQTERLQDLMMSALVTPSNQGAPPA